MDGWGYKSRDVGDLTGIAHMTIEGWLSDKHQASPDNVSSVAELFGWTGGQLYSGEVPAGIMDRVAELDGFRARATRLASAILREEDSGQEHVPIAPRQEQEVI